MNAPVRSFEETRRIPGWPAYCVSESGKVGRIGKPGWLSPSRSKRGGYLIVSLWTNNRGVTKPVHQLVAIAFIGPRPSRAYDCAHFDGDKGNNHWRNLRWATRAENEADKVRHGVSNRGERNGSAKLTDEQTVEIRRRASVLPRSAAGVRVRKGGLQTLAAEYSVTPSAIWQIINGYRRLSA